MEVVLEILHLADSGPGLFLESGPSNELGLTAWYPVQSLCEPCVEVQSHGRMGQSCKRALVEGHSVFLEAVEVIEA